MKTNTIFKITQYLAVFGTLLAVYLLVAQITLSDFRPCSINASINCDAVIDGPVAKTFGIPTPLYGLLGYMIIFGAATFKKKKTILAMATGGLAFCLWIAYKELFELRVICIVCIMCQLTMISIFGLAIKNLKTKSDALPQPVDTDLT